MSLTLKKNYKKDKRLEFRTFVYNDKLIRYWVTGLDLTFLTFFKKFTFSIVNTNNYNNKNILNIHVSYTQYIYLAIFLKNLLNTLYTVMDLAVLPSNSNTVVTSYACLLTNERIVNYSLVPKFKKLKSLSNLYKSTQWVERELQEFNYINFDGITDSRRLLTDYVYHKQLGVSSYKLDSYDLICQDIF